MKLKPFILSAPILFILISHVYAQNQVRENRAVEILKRFYTDYSTIKLTLRDLPKSDSLQKLYCTKRMRQEVKEDFGNGYDLLTGDWGINKEALKTMVIQKAPNKPNTYIVSYIADTFPISPDKMVKRQVSLYVGVVIEDHGYKIDSVVDSSEAK